MKNLLTSRLAATLSLALLAGCNGTVDEDTTPTFPTTGPL